MNANEQRLLTTRELARRLSVGQGKVRNMARDGRIPGVRLDTNGWRFDFAAVLAALQAEAEAERAPAEVQP
jgi:excisionase family DNA binding protein